MVRTLVFVTACVAALTCVARGGEKSVQEELAALREEVAALRAEIVRLGGDSSRARGLLAAAKKLKADGKLEDGSPELAAIGQCLRDDDDLGSRAMGLLPMLTPGQRAAILEGVLLDFSADDDARRTALGALVEAGGEGLKATILKAIEAERLLPTGRSRGGRTPSDLRPALALAAGEVKEKVAVDLAIEYLKDRCARAEADAGRGRDRNRNWRQMYSSGFYGSARTLLQMVKHWSGKEALGKYLEREGRWGYYRINTKERAAVLKDELVGLEEWWKANREGFTFPEKGPEDEAPKPAKEGGEQGGEQGGERGGERF
jgi:hypothetical protein